MKTAYINGRINSLLSICPNSTLGVWDAHIGCASSGHPPPDLLWDQDLIALIWDLFDMTAGTLYLPNLVFFICILCIVTCVYLSEFHLISPEEDQN